VLASVVTESDYIEAGDDTRRGSSPLADERVTCLKTTIPPINKTKS
jgi:hypothetical protein